MDFRVLLVLPAAPSPVAERIAEALREVVPWEACAEGEPLRERLEGAREGALLVLIPAEAAEPLTAARPVRRWAPGAHLGLVVAQGEEAALRRRLGVVPMLGQNWFFVAPEPARIRLAVERAQRSTGQRRAVQTTIRRVGEALGRERPAVVTPLGRRVQSDRYLASVLRHGFDAVICLGERGEVVTWNRAAESLLGSAESAVIGRTLGDISLGGALDGLRGLAERVAREKGDCRAELECRRADGALAEIDVIAAAVRGRSGSDHRHVAGRPRHRRAAAGRGSPPRRARCPGALAR